MKIKKLRKILEEIGRPGTLRTDMGGEIIEKTEFTPALQLGTGKSETVTEFVVRYRFNGFP